MITEMSSKLPVRLITCVLSSTCTRTSPDVDPDCHISTLRARDNKSLISSNCNRSDCGLMSMKS